MPAKRDYNGALEWFITLLRKDKKNTQIRLRFADTLVLAGKKNEAVKQLRIVADELADKGFMIRAIAINKKNPSDRSAPDGGSREVGGDDGGSLRDVEQPSVSGGSFDAPRRADPAR